MFLSFAWLKSRYNNILHVFFVVFSLEMQLQFSFIGGKDTLVVSCRLHEMKFEMETLQQWSFDLISRFLTTTTTMILCFHRRIASSASKWVVAAATTVEVICIRQIDKRRSKGNQQKFAIITMMVVVSVVITVSNSKNQSARYRRSGV